MKHLLQSYKNDFEVFANGYIEAYPVPSNRLKQAIAYSFLNGGKRIRAQMTYIIGDMLKVERTTTQRLAFAIEAIHAYSLIHDDLPAMDDDDLRRGKPTCHIQFDEATAILAGDALQTLAFEVLSEIENIDLPQLKKLITTLGQCSGAMGMISGQQMDLCAESKTVSLEHLMQVHLFKTGKMFIAALQLPFIASRYHNHEQYLKALEQYASAVGVAFQIKDDILDITVDTTMLGKNAQSDLKHAKSTYPALLGLAGAKAHLQQQIISAKKALNVFHTFDTQALSALADHIGSRSF